jgi:hypothetical protein
MGVRILADHKPDATCWFCSVDGVAFGPIFRDVNEAREFDAYYQQVLDPLYGDPRSRTDDELATWLQQWRERSETS